MTIRKTLRKVRSAARASVRSYVGLSVAHKRGYPRLHGQLAGDGCPCYHFSKFGRAALSMTLAPMLGCSRAQI